MYIDTHTHIYLQDFDEDRKRIITECVDNGVDKLLLPNIDKSSIEGPILGHVGDGNFHAILLIDPDSPRDKEEAFRLSDRMIQRALELGGTCSGEHGVGMGKLKYMEAQYGYGWEVMGQIKRQLDPLNIMNPGKLVRQN
mgnify:CR=1 FL=1